MPATTQYVPQYFFYWPNKGQIVFYEAGSRKSLLAALSKHANEIKSYIKENKLNLRRYAHILDIVVYYNYLEKQTNNNNPD